MAHDNLYNALAVAVIFVIYLLRNTHPIFHKIWETIKVMGLVLLFILLIGFAKKSVKEWWNK
jgi:chromate transport protein ChrA